MNRACSGTSGLRLIFQRPKDINETYVNKQDQLTPPFPQASSSLHKQHSSKKCGRKHHNFTPLNFKNTGLSSNNNKIDKQRSFIIIQRHLVKSDINNDIAKQSVGLGGLSETSGKNTTGPRTVRPVSDDEVSGQHIIHHPGLTDSHNFPLPTLTRSDPLYPSIISVIFFSSSFQAHPPPVVMRLWPCGG
ncbi:hypothetical protein TNIN_67661 [Trichonephila inaurata madagascariensis]|uniref:Uncharacterized protein n=1 Tax=Trichonephila inaurata madagascariensis TaxID=2747483 RepID=A0A8X6IJA8_9ARAC|nr:hypothetical protein TNIN_67661 [Trichonephila inaurata madagascariensis]